MDADVIVIGAGAAGLSVTHQLRAAGLGVVLIEARDRIGGRLWTESPAGWPFAVELGAEFIHGNPPELRRLPAESAPKLRDWSDLDGKLQPAGEFAGGAGQIFQALAARRPPAPDCSFAALIETIPRVTPTARAGALGFIEGFEAADPALISVFSLNREHEAEEEDGAGENGIGGGPRRPRGGYGELLRQLDPVNAVELGTVVQRIAWRRGEARVSARQGGAMRQWRAPRALITLPLGVLQRSPELFDPPLAAKRQALAGLAMGGALRVTLRLHRPVWESARDSNGDPLRDPGFLFGRTAETGHFPTWWALPVMDHRAQITGWAAGRHAWAMAGWPRERVIARALDDLAARLRLPRPDLGAALLEAHTHDWQADPLFLGAYSYARAGAMDAHGALAAPIENTIFFGGEATENSGRHATVHGALRSAARAAEEILAR